LTEFYSKPHIVRADMQQLANTTGVASLPVSGTAPAVGTCNGTGFKFRWEHVAIAVLGGAALVSTGMLYTQWKHASLGRRVSGDVVDFLKTHGATVNGKKIVGGPVSVPMDVDEAVVSTVDTILKDISRRATRPPRAGQQQQQAAQDQVLPPSGGGGMPTPSSGGRPSPKQSPSMVPQQGGAQGPPQFPDPPISGKTGMPVSREAMLESGSVSQGGYPSESGGREEDFSYAPPMPPGMVPPTQMP
jgi:hypothetical protein